MTTATSDIDALFQLPLTEFTAARNALAGRLKAAGDDEAAATVKGLSKPPLSAWVVNQLYWRDRKAFDQLMAAGERLRKAQKSQLAGRGGELRAPIDARREALAELTTRAGALLRESGHTLTPELARRVTTTLEALATYSGEPSAPRAGRLTSDVDSPGFEALAALMPRKGRGTRSTGPSRVIPFRQRTERNHPKKLDAAGKKRQRQEERKAQRAAVAAALREAQQTLGEARTAAAQAEAALKKAAGRAKVAEKKKMALEKRFEKATADADTTRQKARRVASAAEEAAQAVADAERALDQAQAAITALTD